jgi:uncharacterized protein YbjT (DUF2867 family)
MRRVWRPVAVHPHPPRSQTYSRHPRGCVWPPRGVAHPRGQRVQGFYWPTAIADANEVVRTCEGCQFYACKTNLPAHALQTIPVTWPFAVWGINIVGPLRKAPGGYTHLLVAVDKFSKWIEACPITNLRAEQVVSFFTDIIHWLQRRTPSSPTMAPSLPAENS